MKQATHKEYGISAIGMAIPSYALPLTELAKDTESLGCQVMGLCAPDENVITLAIKAAQRALKNWRGSGNDIGLIIVATESAVDMSRPLSSWVMGALGIHGSVRSYEVKHACYAGTAAVRQAMEWQLSGNSKGKAALVVAADVALYAPGHSGEPTQGAGAVAMIIDTPDIAVIHPISYYWSDPQFDFWRPVGHAYPEVNGRLSLSCYTNAALQCFKQLAPQELLSNYLQDYEYICLHVPFPKMVHKAIKRLGEYCGWDATEIHNQYMSKVYATMDWNMQIGNSYTASLWFSVANTFTKLYTKQKLLAFSYGSGCGAELLSLQCTNNQDNSEWKHQLITDLENRKFIDHNIYQTIRDKQ